MIIGLLRRSVSDHRWGVEVSSPASRSIASLGDGSTFASLVSVRTFTSIPSVVLVLCVFLPALRVCNDPTAPITFPPCYAAYFGGIGVALIALARRRALEKLGAAIVLVLGVLTLGGVFAMLCERSKLSVVVVCVLTLVSAILAVRGLVRAPLSERWLATIALVQGSGSAIWAACLAFDVDGMWGATLTLVAAIVLVCAALGWLRQTACEPLLPRATLL